MDAAEIDEILLPDFRGRRKVALPPPSFAVVRALGLDDLPALMAGGALTPQLPRPRLSAVGSVHHLLAQLVAEGKSNIDVGLITGYTPQYVGQLRGDPAFAELVAHYMSERERVFVDVLERINTLGVQSVEELMRRVELDAGKFKPRELMEIAKLALDAAKGGGSSGASGPQVAISVNFVPGEAEPGGSTISVEANK